MRVTFEFLWKFIRNLLKILLNEILKKDHVICQRDHKAEPKLAWISKGKRFRDTRRAKVRLSTLVRRQR